MSIANVIRSKVLGLRQVMQFDNCWQLAISRAVFREPLNLYRLGDIVFLEDHSSGDANGARDVLTGSMYRRFFSQLNLPANLRLLDLGASNGGFPLLLKRMGFSIGSIIAVEMHPRTFRRLRFNIDANFDCEVSVINAAIAGREGSITLHLGRGSTGDSILRQSEHGVPVSIPLITLDQLVGGLSIDLVKMDVEGAEFEIFEADTWAGIRKCRYLMIEIHEQYGDPVRVFERLAEGGFYPLEGTRNRGGVHCFVNKHAEAASNSQTASGLIAPAS